MEEEQAAAVEVDEATREALYKAYFDDGMTFTRVAETVGLDITTTRKVLAEKIIEINKNQTGITGKRRAVSNESKRLLFLEEFAKTGDPKAAAEKVGITPSGAHRWLRPKMSYKYAVMASPVAEDALIQNALRSLAREDQRDAELSDWRVSLATDLYKKAQLFWDRAAEKAQVNKVPDKELKALVSAAHYAVHDAQLLGGQPTERVEGLLRELEGLSDEELQRFVYGEDAMILGRSEAARDELDG